MTQHYVTNEADEIDLTQLFIILFDRKWTILISTLIFFFASILLSPKKINSYTADALIHIGDSNSNASPLPTLFGQNSSNTDLSTEIELIKSRTILNKVINILNLDIVTELTFNNTFLNKLTSSKSNINDPQYKYIVVSTFENNSAYNDIYYCILVGENQLFQLFNSNEEFILEGKVGENIHQENIKLKINELVANPGDKFKLSKLPKQATIEQLTNAIKVELQGKTNSGLLKITTQNSTPQKAQLILQTLLKVVIESHIMRNSLEVKNSLDFLHSQLPLMEQSLTKSETRFNNYRKSKDTIDIDFESKTLLQSINEINDEIQNLKNTQLELSNKFKDKHPLLQNIQKKIQSFELQKSTLQIQLSKLSDTKKKLLHLNRQVKISTDTYTQLLSKTQELELEIVRAGTSKSIKVIDQAEVNHQSISNNKTSLIAVLGALLGFIISSSVVLILKFFKSKIERPAEIESIGFPVFSVIPYSESQNEQQLLKNDQFILSVENSEQLTLESFRALRTNLHFAMVENKNNIVMISGPAPNVGKSFVAQNLAIVVAQSNKKVLLIDADLRKGRLHKSFGIESKLGLSDYLSENAKYDNIVHHSEIANLDIISKGTLPPNPSDILMSPKLESLIEHVKNDYDLVIIDTPPILTVTDPMIIGKYACATMIVARYNETSTKEMTMIKQRFKQHGITINGVILNGSKIKRNSKYSYY